MANLSHIKLPDGTVLDLPSGGGGGGTKNVWYGTCPTAKNTGDKVVTTSTGDFTLTAGNVLIVKFTNQSTASTNYLQVDSLTKTLVKTIGGQGYGRYFWQEGETVPFVYDGTYFLLIKGATATTSYYGLTKLNASVTSTSNVEAAAAGAVKTAYDLAASKSEVVANDTTGTSGGSLSSIKINGTSYTISGGGGGGAGLNIPLDYSYSALVALSGDTVYLTSGTTISKSSIESTLHSGGAINFTFNNLGTFDGEATLIGYEKYSDGFGTYQRGLAVLTDGSSTKTYTVEFVWDYQDNIQNLVFTALSGGGGSGFGITTPVAYLDYGNGVVQNTTIDSGLMIVVNTTNPIPASNFVLECSYGNTVAISAMAYAIIDGYSNRYNSFDDFVQSHPQVQDQCSLVVWYTTTGTMIWKTTIPLIVNDISSVSVELVANQYSQASSTQANFVGD